MTPAAEQSCFNDKILILVSNFHPTLTLLKELIVIMCKVNCICEMQEVVWDPILDAEVLISLFVPCHLLVIVG